MNNKCNLFNYRYILGGLWLKDIDTRAPPQSYWIRNSSRGVQEPVPQSPFQVITMHSTSTLIASSSDYDVWQPLLQGQSWLPIRIWMPKPYLPRRPRSWFNWSRKGLRNMYIFKSSSKWFYHSAKVENHCSKTVVLRRTSFRDKCCTCNAVLSVTATCCSLQSTAGKPVVVLRFAIHDGTLCPATEDENFVLGDLGLVPWFLGHMSAKLVMFHILSYT